MSSPPMILQGILVLVVIVAAAFDLRYRRIPNWLTLSGLVLGIGLNSLLVAEPGLHWYDGYNWRSSLAGFGLAFVIYFPLYLLRGMGAGDVKLMAAIGSLVGPVNWFGVFVLSNVLGGLAAVVLLLFRGRVGKTFGNVGFMLSEMAHMRAPYARKEELDVKSPKAATMPHGLAIAIGSLAFLAAAAIWAP